MKTCCGYLLEAPRRAAWNEYPQCMYSWRTKEKYFPATTYRVCSSARNIFRMPISLELFSIKNVILVNQI